jgi:uncharacterized protein (TIGR04255 family)
MNKDKSQSLPDYEKPPVVEVVCGIVFETIKAFKGHHLGLFWQKVRDEFPGCDHAARLGFNPEVEPFDLANYLPRAWFVSAKQNTLIQLQDNMFFFNWRRMQEDEDYPRYSTIIEAFKTNLAVFHEFLQEEDLGSVTPKTCELTYINHIPKGEGWESLSEIKETFPDLAWNSTEKRFLPQPITLSGQIVFPMPDDKGRLNVTLQRGEKKQPDKCPVLILQIKAQGLGGEKSMDAVWEWFEVAHEWIVRGFTDLTGTTIQKEVWRRLDST